jgi:hypothetical protein
MSLRGPRRARAHQYCRNSALSHALALSLTSALSLARALSPLFVCLQLLPVAAASFSLSVCLSLLSLSLCLDVLPVVAARCCCRRCSTPCTTSSSSSLSIAGAGSPYSSWTTAAPAYVSICQHTPAYVSRRQQTLRMHACIIAPVSPFAAEFFFASRNCEVRRRAQVRFVRANNKRKSNSV